VHKDVLKPLHHVPSLKTAMELHFLSGKPAMFHWLVVLV